MAHVLEQRTHFAICFVEKYDTQDSVISEEFGEGNVNMNEFKP